MATSSSDMNAALEAQARFVQKVRSACSAEDRLAEFAKLQQSMMETLGESDAGYKHFLRRNLQSRRVEVIDGQHRPVSPARRALLP